MLCDQPSMIALVVSGIVKADAECADTTRAMCLHERGDGRRIDPPREECADGDVRNDLVFHRLGKEAVQFDNCISFRTSEAISDSRLSNLLRRPVRTRAFLATSIQRHN